MDGIGHKLNCYAINEKRKTSNDPLARYSGSFLMLTREDFE